LWAVKGPTRSWQARASGATCAPRRTAVFLERKLELDLKLIRILPLYGQNSEQVRQVKAEIELLAQKLRKEQL